MAPKSTIAQPMGSFKVTDSPKNVTPRPIETIGTKNIADDAMIEPAASRTFKFQTKAMPLQICSLTEYPNFSLATRRKLPSFFPPPLDLRLCKCDHALASK